MDELLPSVGATVLVSPVQPALAWAAHGRLPPVGYIVSILFAAAVVAAFLWVPCWAVVASATHRIMSPARWA